VAPRRSWKRRAARWFVLYAVIPYVALILLFTAVQRKLLYPATRAPVIGLEDSRLPADRIRAAQVRTHDGLTLNGWLALAAPAAEPDARRILIVCFPGNSGNRIERAADCRDFADLGCDVLLVDYRGYGDNPGSPAESDLAADARSIWGYATNDLGVAPARIVLFGESLGGGVATRLAAEQSAAGQPPGGLVLSSTFSSMTDAVWWHYPWFPVPLMLLDRYPSADRIASVTCPILVFHGTEDDFVPIESGRKLFAAAPETSTSGIPKRFVELRGAGHNDIPASILRDAVRALLTDSRLPASGDASE
jgi:uncharacterized protein